MQSMRRNWLLLIAAASAVHGMPYMLLKNKAPKCYQVEVPSRTIMYIKYHVPDLVIIDDVKEDEKKEEEAGTEKERKLERDGMDARYNDRFQKRMETLKRAHLKDINISVTPRDSNGAIIPPSRQMDNDPKIAKFPMKWREQLESHEGMFQYDTDELEGSVEICIQSYTATAESPSRVAVSVTPQTENDDIEKQLLAERVLMNERLEAENKIVKEETSRISAELVRMQRRAKSIAGDAQFSKAREETFFGQSISLNRAVRYWPIVRIVVLLIGGYLQVTHVINYMKSRHIY